MKTYCLWTHTRRAQAIGGSSPSHWEGPSLLYFGSGAKPEEPKPEARARFLGRGQPAYSLSARESDRALQAPPAGSGAEHRLLKGLLAF